MYYKYCNKPALRCCGCMRFIFQDKNNFNKVQKIPFVLTRNAVPLSQSGTRTKTQGYLACINYQSHHPLNPGTEVVCKVIGSG